MLFIISNSKLGIWFCSQIRIYLNSQSNFYDVLTRPYKYLSNTLSTLSTKQHALKTIYMLVSLICIFRRILCDSKKSSIHGLRDLGKCGESGILWQQKIVVVNFFCLVYFILYLSNYKSLSLQILYGQFVTSQSGEPSSHMMDSIITSMSLNSQRYFQRKRSGSGNRRVGQVLSIKPTIYHRPSMTTLKQGSPWSSHSVIFMSG